MEYFDLFGIPVQLKLNPADLSARFFALSRQFHPDRVAQDDAAAQEEALEKSALLNKAWKTFHHPDALIHYVLKEKGLITDDEKYNLPPSFLMEVMDINEQLMELDEDADTGVIEEELNNLSNQIYEPVKKVVENYEEGVTSGEALLQVKEYYYKKKYLDRIREELQNRAIEKK